MHGGLQQNAVLVGQLRAALQEDLRGVAIFAPYPYLGQLQGLCAGSGLSWGAQNVSEFAQGAYTGEVSAAMLGDFGCRYVLIGHSERRSLFGEGDDCVARKVASALGANLLPVVCVGETLAEREAGDTSAVVLRQLQAVVDVVGAKALAEAVLAYEPVWAIGTGKTATPAQAQEVHALLRKHLAVQDADLAARMPILYGGSVKAANAAELFALPDVDGGLVGGASLSAEEFVAICRARTRNG